MHGEEFAPFFRDIGDFKPHQQSALASKLCSMHNRFMRTTITLDDQTHEFAAYYARARGLTLGAAIDELIRKAQAAPAPARREIEHSPNGLPLLPRTGMVITSEMVKKLSEEEFEPEAFTRCECSDSAHER